MGSTDSSGSLVARTTEATNHMVVVEVDILSAQGLEWPEAPGLKRLKFWSSTMWPYVNAWNPDDQDAKASTLVSKGPNPVWHDLKGLHPDPLLVVFKKEQIFSKNAELKLEVLHRSSGVGKNKHLGTATIALSHVHFSDPSKVFVCPLVHTSGREQGVIEFTMTIKPCVRPNLSQAASMSSAISSTSVTSYNSPETTSFVLPQVTQWKIQAHQQENFQNSVAYNYFYFWT
jgi:hypothetical protein